MPSFYRDDMDRSLFCRHKANISWLVLMSIATMLILSSFCGLASAMNDKDSIPSKQIAASLTEDYEDHGIDINGDGLYDLLAVDAGVDVLLAGEYTLSGYLYDSRNRYVSWSIDHVNLTPGRNKMRLEFEGKSIQQHGSSGNFSLRNLILTYGSSETGMTICEYIPEAFLTSAYNFSQFAILLPEEKTLSGSGNGELLLKFNIRRTLPVISGRYSLDILGIRIPPISSQFNVIGSANGYAYDVEGTYLPSKPNNFTVTAYGVKNLNIGLKKIQGSYTGNSSTIWEGQYMRMWVSHQAVADDQGVATDDSDLISPGIYDARIFGDAADVSKVDLTMTLVKKIFINGKFHLSINTTGFPAGDYSIDVQAQNGTVRLDEIALDGLSISN
jgi:hypothetical protein